MTINQKPLLAALSILFFLSLSNISIAGVQFEPDSLKKYGRANSQRIREISLYNTPHYLFGILSLSRNTQPFAGITFNGFQLAYKYSSKRNPMKFHRIESGSFGIVSGNQNQGIAAGFTYGVEKRKPMNSIKNLQFTHGLLHSLGANTLLQVNGYVWYEMKFIAGFIYQLPKQFLINAEVVPLSLRLTYYESNGGNETLEFYSRQFGQEFSRIGASYRFGS